MLAYDGGGCSGERLFVRTSQTNIRTRVLGPAFPFLTSPAYSNITTHQRTRVTAQCIQQRAAVAANVVARSAVMQLLQLLLRRLYGQNGFRRQRLKGTTRFHPSTTFARERSVTMVADKNSCLSIIKVKLAPSQAARQRSTVVRVNSRFNGRQQSLHPRISLTP